jgi:heme-degrading monooxygenase HmoA
MICCSFVFEPGEYDQEFYELDSEINKYARSLAGFIKTERWQSKNGLFVNSMYFFENEESVRELSS